jgi:hypothetical protein
MPNLPLKGKKIAPRTPKEYNNSLKRFNFNIYGACGLESQSLLQLTKKKLCKIREELSVQLH